jgi:hypothetical protein
MFIRFKLLKYKAVLAHARKENANEQPDLEGQQPKTSLRSLKPKPRQRKRGLQNLKTRLQNLKPDVPRLKTRLQNRKPELRRLKTKL